MKKQDARAVLADNIHILVQHLGGIQMDLVRRTGVKQKTLNRASHNENPATLDQVNKIAHGMGLQPWQLLVPNLDPDNPPRLAHSRPAAPLLVRVKDRRRRSRAAL